MALVARPSGNARDAAIKTRRELNETPVNKKAGNRREHRVTLMHTRRVTARTDITSTAAQMMSRRYKNIVSHARLGTCRQSDGPSGQESSLTASCVYDRQLSFFGLSSCLSAGARGARKRQSRSDGRRRRRSGSVNRDDLFLVGGQIRNPCVIPSSMSRESPGLVLSRSLFPERGTLSLSFSGGIFSL